MLRFFFFYKIEVRGNIVYRSTVFNFYLSLISYSVGICSIKLVTGVMWIMDIGLSSLVVERLIIV